MSEVFKSVPPFAEPRRLNSTRSRLPAWGYLVLLALSISRSLAQDWVPSSPIGPGYNWSRIACSADGTKLLVVDEDPGFGYTTDHVWASTNSATDWLEIDKGQAAGSDVAGSADGTKWIVASSVRQDNFFSYSPGAGFQGPAVSSTTSYLVTSSRDGTNLAAAGYDMSDSSGRTYRPAIFTSTNAGRTWQTALTNVSISCLASSADGLTLVAGTPTNVIYISTNLGANWTTNLVSPQWVNGWSSVGCSANPAMLFAASGDGIFVSTDSGSTWSQIHGPDTFQNIAVSSDGTYLAAAANPAIVYTSTNSGSTWTRFNLGEANPGATSVAMSADGSKMFAAVWNGLIYSYHAPPPARALKIVASGTNMIISWPYPSTSGFVLEQASSTAPDFWTVVTNEPSLNQVTIPAPTGPIFFRLASYETLRGTFQNLDFESATISPVPGDTYNRIVFSQAFPGWTGFENTNQATLALYTGAFLDSSGFGLQTNSFFASLQEGRYSATIQTGYSLFDFPHHIQTNSLSQTGTVPIGARSLIFRAHGDNFVVSLGGKPLTLVPLGTPLYGANVTNFSGQTAELRFTVLPTPPPRVPINGLSLDSISFSARPVP